ncbi:ABC transporter permease [Bowmanella denitrificans]|uniref:ABC transporter permease n=1 Tax=Bowmanella denitrificans TaxID=366582 RepID=A0ABP3H6F1_9ALTE
MSIIPPALPTKCAVIALTLRYLWLQTKQRTNLIQLLTLTLLFFYLSFITLLGSGAQHFLQQNLQQLLGADSVVQGYRPLPDDALDQLKARVEQLSETRVYRLTLTHQPEQGSGQVNAEFVQLKAVDDHYPLQGQVHISQSASLVALPTAHGPAPGHIWLEPRVAAALSIQLGDVLILGQARLRFSALLIGEPDRLLEGHSTDMRAMVHQHSLNVVATEQALEVKTYRYLLAHTESQLQTIQPILAAHSDLTLTSKALGNHPLASAWQRVEKFMGLVTVLLVVIAAITLALSHQSTLLPITHFTTLCVANGMPRSDTWLVALCGSLYMLFISLLPALLLAILSAELTVIVLAQFDIAISLDWQINGVLNAVLLGAAIFVCLSLGAWLNVIKTPISTLLRQAHRPTRLSMISWALPLCAVAALVWWYSDNWTLTTMILGTLALCLGFLMLLTWAVLSLGRWGLTSRATLFGFTLYLMQKRIVVKGAQIIALGLSLTLLLLCVRISQDVTDVLEQLSFREQGNVIVSQVDDRQKQALEAFVGQHNGSLNPFFAFQYAQLTHINNAALADTGLQPSETLARMARPIRLHWRTQLATNNRIEQGTWPDTAQLQSEYWPVTVEAEVFEDLQLNLGDILSMQLDSRQIQLQVVAVHSYVRGGSPVTFWFVGQAQAPITGSKVWYMGDVDLPEQALAELGQLWQSHPGMRLIAVESLLGQTRFYLNVLLGMVLGISLFIALLSNLLMAAAIQVHLEQDKVRNALLLSFGLGKGEQIRVVVYEWAVITLLPAFAAMTSVYLCMQAFYTHELGLPYQANGWRLTLEAISMALGIATGGILMARRQLQQSVRQLLTQQ